VKNAKSSGPRVRALACLLALLCALALPAAAQKVKKPKAAQRAGQNAAAKAASGGANADENAAADSGPLELQVLAETWRSTPDNHLIASGNVEVHYGGVTLFADQVDLDKDTKDVQADGHCVLQSPNEVTTGDSLFFNLDTALGRMENVEGIAQPNIFFKAALLEREAPDYYHFERTQFTTCAQPNPRWKFSCSKANYKKDDYIEMTNMVLSVKGIPVFYFPYFRYPIKDRATGLLEPKIGHTNTKGWKYSQDFYLSLSRNMDATLNFLYYSLMGYGGGLEYRYLFGGGMGGQIKLFDFAFKKGANGELIKSAYIIRVLHNQTLPLGFQLVANVDLQSSFDFLRNFDNNFSRATTSNRRSQVFLTNTFSGFTLSAQASRFETYFQSVNNAIRTQYLPQVNFSSFKMPIIRPLYFSFTSSFSAWQYGWTTDFDKGKQKRLTSASFSPTLSLPFNAIPWLSLTGSFSGNYTYYWQSLVPAREGAKPTLIADSPLSTLNYDFVLDLRGPTIYKTFTNSENMPTVKHILEPFITYRYDSPTDDSDRIVTAVGRFFRYHTLTYGLTNHILVKQDKMPREMLTLELSQVHYLSPEDGPLSIYRFMGRVPTASDISASLRFFPVQAFSLDVSSSYNTYHNLFSSIRLGGRIGNPADDFYLNVSWLKGQNPWNDFVYLNRHQINIFGGLKIPALDFEAQGEFDYNISKNEILFAGLDAIYHYQCVDFKANLRIYNFRAQRDVEYSFSIGLGGITHSADFLGGLGF
jgi:LPS-assembly protein